MSAPTTIRGQHTYEYNGDRRTRTGPIKIHNKGPSFEVAGTTQRYLPYEMEIVGDKLSKNKNTRKK